MSKQRVVKDEIWDDDWFYELDPSEKLVWLFLLTNPRGNIAGIYKLNKKWASQATGLDFDVFNTILSRFVKYKKILDIENWIGLVNFHKHVAYRNASVAQGILRLYKEGTGCPQALYSLWLTLLNSTLLYLSDTKDKSLINQITKTLKEIETMYEYTPVDESGEPRRRKSSGKGKEVKARNAELINLGFLFEKLGEQSTGVKPNLTKSYFILKNAKEKCGVEDFESLFKYFFSDPKLSPEQKVSLAFVCSPSYITKWKVSLKNKVASQVEASSDIRL